MSFFCAAFSPAARKRRHADGVGGDGLFGEDVLAGVDGGLEVHRGGSRAGVVQHDDVDVGGDHLLEGVEADEVLVGVDLDAGREVVDQILARHAAARRRWRSTRDAGVAAEELGVAQALEASFELVLEDVGHGDEFDVFVAGEHVDDGLRAAPAAADQAGLEPFLAGAAHQIRADEGEGGAAQGGGIPQQGTAG